MITIFIRLPETRADYLFYNYSVGGRTWNSWQENTFYMFGLYRVI